MEIELMVKAKLLMTFEYGEDDKEAPEEHGVVSYQRDGQWYVNYFGQTYHHNYIITSFDIAGLALLKKHERHDEVQHDHGSIGNG